MSNYTFEAKNRNHETFIGWDPQLNTFFLHIIDTSKSEDDEGYDVEWIDTTFNEIRDLDFLLEKAKEYGEVAAMTKRNLYRDAHE